MEPSVGNVRGRANHVPYRNFVVLWEDRKERLLKLTMDNADRNFGKDLAPYMTLLRESDLDALVAFVQQFQYIQPVALVESETEWKERMRETLSNRALFKRVDERGSGMAREHRMMWENEKMTPLEEVPIDLTTSHLFLSSPLRNSMNGEWWYDQWIKDGKRVPSPITIGVSSGSSEQPIGVALTET